MITCCIHAFLVLNELPRLFPTGAFHAKVSSIELSVTCRDPSHHTPFSAWSLLTKTTRTRSRSVGHTHAAPPLRLATSLAKKAPALCLENETQWKLRCDNITATRLCPPMISAICSKLSDAVTCSSVILISMVQTCDPCTLDSFGFGT